MNNEMTVEMLKSLKLYGMAESFSDLMNMPMQMRPGLDVAMAKMVEAEQCFRNNSRTEKLLKASHMKLDAYIEDVECSVSRNLTKAMLMELADCSFVRRGENLLVTGLTGTGKTYVIKAIGRQACIMGHRTLYMNMNRFVDTIAQSRLDGTFQKLIDKLNRNDLIILDDFGLATMTSDTRLALLQILEERYDEKSVIIAAQLPVGKWYEYISESTMADAIMDRLINSSTHIELKGESMRKRRRR